MTDILLLAANPHVTRLVGSLPGHEVASLDRGEVEGFVRVDGRGSLVALDRDRVPEIIILGDEMPVGEALSIAQAIDSVYPLVEVMLVAEADTALALRAMRVGIREIIEPTIDEDNVKVLIHRAGATVTSRMGAPAGANDGVAAGNGHVVVVASPKGGVGKSTVATNLAVALARSAPMETVLVDLDIQFGDVAVLLDLKPAHSIEDAFSTSAALDTLILKTFLTMHPAGFYALAGADSPVAGDHITAAHVKRLIAQLESQFRYIVVDTAAGLNELTLAALEEGDDVVLVSSMDVSSIRAMRKEIDVLAELELLPASRHLVLNFADRRSGLAERDVEAVVGMPVHVVIPRSQDVSLAGNRGEPLLLAKKPGPVGAAVVKLAGRVAIVDASRPFNVKDGKLPKPPRAGKPGRAGKRQRGKDE